MARSAVGAVPGGLGALLLAACMATPSPPLPPPVPIVDIGMSEYRFDHFAVVQAGRTIFRVKNVGSEDHEFTLVALPPDFHDPVSSLFDGGESRTIATTALVFAKPPGDEARLAVDLFPGRYALICFVEDPSGTQHMRRGMFSELTVTGGPGRIMRPTGG